MFLACRLGYVSNGWPAQNCRLRNIMLDINCLLFRWPERAWCALYRWISRLWTTRCVLASNLQKTKVQQHQGGDRETHRCDRLRGRSRCRPVALRPAVTCRRPSLANHVHGISQCDPRVRRTAGQQARPPRAPPRQAIGKQTPQTGFKTASGLVVVTALRHICSASRPNHRACVRGRAR